MRVLCGAAVCRPASAYTRPRRRSMMHVYDPLFLPRHMSLEYPERSSSHTTTTSRRPDELCRATSSVVILRQLPALFVGSSRRLLARQSSCVASDADGQIRLKSGGAGNYTARTAATSTVPAMIRTTRHHTLIESLSCRGTLGTAVLRRHDKRHLPEAPFHVTRSPGDP